MPERDESQDDHKRFIEENYDAIVRVARDGYLQHGRGAVFLFEDSALDVLEGRAAVATIEYVASGSDALARRGGWPTPEHGALVSSYDPNASMIILVARRRNGRDLFTYQMALEASAPGLVRLESRLGERDLE
jgi:hypothetical protein